MTKGYKCIGYCKTSKKIPEIPIRRIKLKGEKAPYQVVPSFVMPYITGYSKEVEKALYFHFKYEVSFDDLVYGFGKDVSYWYRQCQQIDRLSIVGTTIQDTETLPEDIAADEKHTRWNGQTAYIATTVGKECFWGVSICLKADEASLIDAYVKMKHKGLNLAMNLKQSIPMALKAQSKSGRTSCSLQ